MKKFILPAVLVIILLVIFALSVKDKAPATGNVSQSESTVTVNSPEALVAVQEVKDNVGLASAAGAKSKTISWEAMNFPTGAGVDINLLRKVSDSPASYSLVRKIASNTNNDGSEIWTPAANETGSDLYIEVTCATAVAFSGGCQASSQPAKAN